MAPTKMTITGMRGLPPTVQSLMSLPRIDYADSYTLHNPNVQAQSGRDGLPSAEEWARASLGDVPSPGQKFVWSWLLQLKLTSGKSKDTVAGWRVTGRADPSESGNDDWIRLEAASWLGDANIIFYRTEADVSFNTAIIYNSWIMRYWWAVLGNFHRKGVPACLKPAKGKLEKKR